MRILLLALLLSGSAQAQNFCDGKPAGDYYYKQHCTGGDEIVPPVIVAPPPVVKPGTACVGGPKFDIAGEKNVGNGRGIQFIGGQCLSGKDCASGCCAGPCGICSGPGAQFQAGKTGCGFGS